MSSPRALVAGHGDFATGILSAVAMITGRDDVFVGMTQRGQSAQDVERLMREHLVAHALDVIFTDLPAGSCTMAARRLQREQPELTIVMGVNLAALLDFVFADALPAGEAARQAAEKGRTALSVVGGSPRGGVRGG